MANEAKYLDSSNTNIVPEVDSNDNDFSNDVIGNKNDTASGNSIVSLLKQISPQNNIEYIKDVWYVDASRPDDSGTGMTPSLAKKTIGAASTLASDGDAIVIADGIYSETGLDISNDAINIIFMPGAQVDVATGNCLTVSGNYCTIVADPSSLLIRNDSSASTGLNITGSFCYIKDVRVSCSSTGLVGFDLNGNGLVLDNCRCSDPLTAAFRIKGDKIKLDDCCTGATPSDNSIGYYFTNNCDKPRMNNCGSQGHGQYGLKVDPGCTNGCIKNFSTGGGDKGVLNDGDNFAITSYDWDELVYNSVEFTGGSPGALNIFELSGVVQINRIYGIVTTALSANVDLIKLELDDGTVQVDITDTVDSDSAPVGSLFIKDDDNTVSLDLQKSDQIRILEPTVSPQKEAQSPFDVITKNGATNYIRVNTNGVATNGVIKWYVYWTPLSDDSVVNQVI